MERYRTYSSYLKELYGEKVYKLPLNIPVTCPNRIDSYGCSFCGGAGTGFEAMDAQVPVREQLRKTKEKISAKYHAEKFIAYFQNYTNTFLPLEQFRNYLQEAAGVEDIVGISVSTRPDCIRKDYLDVLEETARTCNLKITLEYGLQTVNYHTLRQINRGHTLAEYLDAVLMTAPYGFDICTHIILNLPGDTLEDSIETAKILSALPIRSVKLHSLYVPKGSRLYQDFEHGKITLCSKEEYLDRLTAFICYVRSDMVIERLFSRGSERRRRFFQLGSQLVETEGFV